MKNWFIYKHIIDKISLQHYLKKICEIYHNVKIIFSFSIHGNSRYQGINKVNRLRQFCKSDEEDEFHFVLKFPVYDYFQKIVYKKYYRTHPSVFKLVHLLCTENFKDLCNLGIFLMKYFNRRQNIIMSSWVLSINTQPVTMMNIWNFMYVLYSIMYDTDELYSPRYFSK